MTFAACSDSESPLSFVSLRLLTNVEGCLVEVFPGNPQDAATVEGKVKELREWYGVSELVLVGDRGMITANNEEKLAALPEVEGLKIINALTYRQMVNGWSAPLFAEQEQALANKMIQAKDRTLDSILETIKSQRRNQVREGEATLPQLTEPTPEARKILDLLARKSASAP